MGLNHYPSGASKSFPAGQQQRTFLAAPWPGAPHPAHGRALTGVDVTTQETTLVLLERLREQQVTVLV